MHILFVTFFSLFVFHLQVDVVGPLLLNASLLPILTTDYSDWLVHATQLIDNIDSDGVFEFWRFCIRLTSVTSDFRMFVFIVGTAGLRNFLSA